MKEQMNSAEFEHLLDIARRRKLTPEEAARLQSNLVNRSDRVGWEEEVALTRLLTELPNAPLASNFTAQVLLAVEREPRIRRRAPRVVRWFGLHRPVIRVAWACLLLGAVGLGYYAYEAANRAKMAVSLATLATSVDIAAKAVELPSAEAWQDFEPIYRLSHTRPQADLELLAALK